MQGEVFAAQGGGVDMQAIIAGLAAEAEQRLGTHVWQVTPSKRELAGQTVENLRNAVAPPGAQEALPAIRAP